MNDDRLEYGVVSSPEREDLYAELMIDNMQWGEIAIDESSGTTTVKIFKATPAERLEFKTDDLLDFLRAANSRLKEVYGFD